MKIIISPFSQKLRNDKENPKNYPYWEQLVTLIKQSEEVHITQVGRTGEQIINGVDEVKFDLPLRKLRDLLEEMDIFFSVDNFFPHFAHFYGKQGVVLFGRSDPRIFGYKENVNLFEHPKYLRPDQFGLWESCERIEEAFMKPERVLETLNNL